MQEATPCAAPAPADEWYSSNNALATDSEVLLLVLRLVVTHADEKIDAWLAAVLQYDTEEKQQGIAWRPPKSWGSTCFERTVLTAALTREVDAVVACTRVLAQWNGQR